MVFTGAPVRLVLGHHAASHDCETARVSLQRAVLRFRRPASWKTRVVLAVLAADAVVALLGMWVVPAILRWPAGLGAMLAVVCAQFAIAVAAVFGPMSVDKRPRTGRDLSGAGYAVRRRLRRPLGGRLGRPSSELRPRPCHDQCAVCRVAVIAGALACWRTPRLMEGAVAGCWALVIGTAMWSLGWVPLSYALWDSALVPLLAAGRSDRGLPSQRRHESRRVLAAGHVRGHVFHQVLSVVIGVAGGFLGSAIGWAPRTLARGPSRITTTKA